MERRSWQLLMHVSQVDSHVNPMSNRSSVARSMNTESLADLGNSARLIFGHIHLVQRTFFRGIKEKSLKSPTNLDSRK